MSIEPNGFWKPLSQKTNNTRNLKIRTAPVRVRDTGNSEGRPGNGPIAKAGLNTDGNNGSTFNRLS